MQSGEIASNLAHALSVILCFAGVEHVPSSLQMLTVRPRRTSCHVDAVGQILPAGQGASLRGLLRAQFGAAMTAPGAHDMSAFQRLRAGVGAGRAQLMSRPMFMLPYNHRASTNEACFSRIPANVLLPLLLHG